MSKIIMLCGFPAAGKSTICESCAKGYIRLNRDKLGGTLDKVAKKLEAEIKKGKQNFVLDNTYCTAASRESAIAVAKKFNIPIECFVLWSAPKITKVSLDASLADAQFNACTRMVRKYGKLLTPEEIKEKGKKDPNCFPATVQYSYKKNFEKPTKAEGFDDVRVFQFHRRTPTNYTNKALILDYDGTLRTTKNGEKYPTDIGNIKILPNRRKILERYLNDGYILTGVSNQSGVEKENLSWEAAAECFHYTNDALGLNIDFKFCPHHSFPIRCFCRKPLPGLAVELIEKYKLNPSECIMVGDMKSDETFAKRSGFQFVHANEFFKEKVRKR
jgi:HAD superfamily hydrolase (TIGR01662 family)